MSGDIDNVLERRAKLLAGRLTARVDLVRNAVAPKGQRPPFTTQMSKPEALAWWQKNFDTDLGAKVKANMTPEAQLELTLALSQANEAEMFGGGMSDDLSRY